MSLWESIVSGVKNIYDAISDSTYKPNGNPTYFSKEKRWRNGDGKWMPLGKKYRHGNIWVQYNSDGTVTKLYGKKQYAKAQSEYFKARRKYQDKKFGIPNSNQIIIKSDNPKINNLRINQNVVDSLLKYGSKVNISKQEALGLPFTESTIGNHKDRTAGIQYNGMINSKHWRSFNSGNNMYSPVVLLSNWAYFEDNPYDEYLNSTDRITDNRLNQERKASKNSNLQKEDIGWNYLINQERKINYNLHPIESAFIRYKSNIYNTNEKDHTQKVKTNGQLLLTNPQIQQLINNSKYNY